MSIALRLSATREQRQRLRLAPMRAVAALSLLVNACWAPAVHAIGLVDLEGAVYIQNFDSLPDSGTVLNESLHLPDGWSFRETGTGGTITFAADNGTTSTNNTYGYGTTDDSDRAFGELTGPTVNSTIGAGFLNRTGFVITRLTVEYVGEQWRLGAGDANVDRLDFQFSLNAERVNDNGAGVVWTDVNSLDFVTPNNAGASGAKDGNIAVNRNDFPPVFLGNVSIPNGSTFWIRWLSTDITGADDGLAIDDFRLRTTPLADFDLDGDVDGKDFLHWQRGVGATSGAGISSGDANLDGAVDSIDLLIWNQTFDAGATAAVTAVPEPGAAILALLAAGFLRPRAKLGALHIRLGSRRFK